MHALLDQPYSITRILVTKSRRWTSIARQCPLTSPDTSTQQQHNRSSADLLKYDHEQGWMQHGSWLQSYQIAVL